MCILRRYERSTIYEKIYYKCIAKAIAYGLIELRSSLCSFLESNQFRRSEMSYIKATDVLPEELVNLIQNFIEGEYIYIPRKEGNRKAWGELTKSKQETFKRNLEIYEKYKTGVSIKTLCEIYYLSPKSIQRIIRKNRKDD